MNDMMDAALKKRKTIHLTITMEGDNPPELEVQQDKEEIEEPALEDELDPSKDMSEEHQEMVMEKKKPSFGERIQQSAIMKKMKGKKV